MLLACPCRHAHPERPYPRSPELSVLSRQQDCDVRRTVVGPALSATPRGVLGMRARLHLHEAHAKESCSVGRKQTNAQLSTRVPSALMWRIAEQLHACVLERYGSPAVGPQRAPSDGCWTRLQGPSSRLRLVRKLSVILEPAVGLEPTTC